ncbi:hypothetical protein ACLOJK_026984, partial [Asimina triloba]
MIRIQRACHAHADMSACCRHRHRALMAGIVDIEQVVATSVDSLDQAARAGEIEQRLAVAGRGGGVRAAACIPRGSAVAGAYDGRPGFDDHDPCMCRVVDVQQFMGRLQRAQTMARAEMGGVHDGKGRPRQRRMVASMMNGLDLPIQASLVVEEMTTD